MALIWIIQAWIYRKRPEMLIFVLEEALADGNLYIAQIIASRLDRELSKSEVEQIIAVNIKNGYYSYAKEAASHIGRELSLEELKCVRNNVPPERVIEKLTASEEIVNRYLAIEKSELIKKVPTTITRITSDNEEIFIINNPAK